jgi:hypothetical protein
MVVILMKVSNLTGFCTPLNAIVAFSDFLPIF